MAIPEKSKTGWFTIRRLWTTTLWVIVGAVFFKRLLKDKKVVLSFVDFINHLDDNTVFNTNDNQYLKGNFAPVNTENFNVEMEMLSGEMPKDVQGIFLRVGPNPIPSHKSRGYNLFDGHGMIHSVRIKDSNPVYSNQWVGTPRYTHERLHDRPIFVMIGEAKGYLGLFKLLVLSPFITSLFNLTRIEVGVANTAFFQHNSKIYVGHEASYPFEIRWNENNSFSNIGFESFNNVLNYSVSAHCKSDPIENKLYVHGYDPSNDDEMKVGTISGNEVSNYFGIDLPTKTWAHDFMITKNYILLFESSIAFSAKGILEGVFFNFVNDHKLRIGVLPKSSSSSDDIRWFEFPSPFAFIHGMNAWEEAGTDAIVINTPLSDSFDGSLQNANEFRMAQIRLNLTSGESYLDIFDDANIIEFPRVHPEYLGLPSRFGYASKFEPGRGVLNVNGIVKYDLMEKAIAGVISFPPGLYAGEIVPIPKQKKADGNSVKTDGSDGVYLTSFIFNSNTNTSEWHIYDGETMDANPVVSYSIPRRVPYGFHGEWMSEQQLQKHFKNIQ